jgi:hypothetical protein
MHFQKPMQANELINALQKRTVKSHMSISLMFLRPSASSKDQLRNYYDIYNGFAIKALILNGQ